MNFLNIRKGPKMEFVVGEHRNEFEKEIIDIYMSTPGGYWNVVPSLEKGILPDVNPKFIYAGLLGLASGDMSYYVKEYTGKFVDAEFEKLFAFANLNKFETEAPEYLMEALSRIGTDAQSVLEYHNMFYMSTYGYEAKNMKEVQAMFNVPIKPIW